MDSVEYFPTIPDIPNSHIMKNPKHVRKNVFMYIYIYIYIYQSEGFPRTGYFIPAHVGAGAGQIWASFRRRLPGPFLANLAHVWQSTFFPRLGIRKEISARHYLEIARIRCASFSEKCKFWKSVAVSGDNLGPTSFF